MAISHYTIHPHPSRPLSYRYYKLYIRARPINNEITTIISILFPNGAIFPLLVGNFTFTPPKHPQVPSKQRAISISPLTGPVSSRSQTARQVFPGKIYKGIYIYTVMHRYRRTNSRCELRLFAEEGGNNANKHLTNVASRILYGCRVYLYGVIKM